MSLPPKDDPKYDQRREAYNERRRRRREDPDYKANETARQLASKARLKSKRESNSE